MNLRGKKENLSPNTVLCDKKNQLNMKVNRKKTVEKEKSSKAVKSTDKVLKEQNNCGILKYTVKMQKPLSPVNVPKSVPKKEIKPKDITSGNEIEEKNVLKNVNINKNVKPPKKPNKRQILSKENVNSGLSQTKSTVKKPRPKPVASTSKLLSDDVFLKPNDAPIATLKKRKKSNKNGLRAVGNKNFIPPDCFGFNTSGSESDPDFDSCPLELIEFDPSKPFRVALYVRPSKRVRLDSTLVKKCISINPSLNITSANTTRSVLGIKQSMTANSLATSPVRGKWFSQMSSTPKVKGKLVQQKITDTMTTNNKRKRTESDEKTYKSFFDGSDSLENVEPLSPHVNKTPDNNDVSSIDETLDDVKGEIVKDGAFRKPSRKSYVKKPRIIEPAEDEPSSDDILKNLENSKRKAKTKKIEKKDKEYEKWSQSMNNQFDEIEKFEISFD